ncbi:MAG TPA: H(+)/Cl(-) exchange transporter ClcA [Stellaceae bacterium]|nr:H(+)/Cl(-) exchange transporter ClcA [Stellaceae bacterium]
MSAQRGGGAAAEGHGSGLALALVAPLAGGGTGLVVAMFRLALAAVDRWRGELIARGHQHHQAGLVLVVAGCAAAVALAAWLVRRFSPYASGSGIPQVEAALSGELPPAPPRLLPVKFFGGLLAIGAGMALGREGPSVQMGAVVAHLVGRISRRPWPELRVLLAAGAGAGLAVAFNAPIAGAVFVLEELVRRFEPRIAIAALGASSTAILISRLLLGDAPDFQVAVSIKAAIATGPLPYAAAAIWPLYVAMGLVAGLAAALYSRTILVALALAERLGRWSVEVQAGAIGAVVGVVAWFAPGLVGGGDQITQRVLSGGAVLAMIPLAFALRFALGAVCYAARTPGGLFAPMLVLGAQLGLLCGALCRMAFPHLGIEPEAFAVVGMAAFFAGVVQAPVTGIVLATEMTGAFTTLLPMLAACFAAMLAANFLRTMPIYDALRERLGQANAPR